MQQPASFYQKQIDFYSATLSLLKRKLLLASLFRLISFGLVIYSLYLVIASGNSFSYASLVVSVVVFILLIRFFSGYRDEKNLVEQLLFINKNEESVMRNERNSFSSGERHVHQSGYADDLDIFGEGSLYHYLNRTTTSHGEQTLANLLDRPLTSHLAIADQQRALKQLALQPAIMQKIIARGLSTHTGSSDIREVQHWIGTESQVMKAGWVRSARFILPVFNLGALCFYLDSDNPIPIGVGVVLSWLIIGRFAPYITAQHTSIGRKQSVLEQYAAILNQYAALDPANSTILQSLHKTALGGNAAIKQLSRLSSLFDQRLNLLVNIILNSLFLYDIQCILALEKWKAAHKHHFQKWIHAVGEIEMLISLAIYTFNHPRFCFPEVAPGEPCVEALNMAHPLIPTGESVANNVTAGSNEKLLLITGSNMSGKSTFLRTVGVNVLLAHCGAPACAEYFKCSPMRIFSSIRISDSLQEHTSFFMAELKKLKSIIDALSEGVAALVLIDEVLRGTNSDDKTYGSDALIHKLTGYNALTLFASHDLSLSRLEEELPGLVSNYCFESTITDGELMFDYKLRRGVAKNRNATFLMKKMGIIS